MEISEVRIKLMDEAGDRLQAFCSITFDNCFVIRDLKIIEGTNGPFVAMPSRKLTARCPQCGCKNHLRAPYCNQCGLRLKDDRVIKDDTGRAKLYADIAHPINSRCREMIQDRIIQAYREELERSRQPGYLSNYDDYDFEEQFAEAADDPSRRSARTSSAPAAPHTNPAPHISPAPHVSTVAKNNVQPAEPGPRGPHNVPRIHEAPHSQDQPPTNEFGQGIL